MFMEKMSLVHAMSACSVTRRAPSQHRKDTRAYGHTTTAMHEMGTTPPPHTKRGRTH